MVMSEVAYPTIFTETGTNILIEIPDLDILTEANSEDGKTFVSVVDVDLLVYRQKNDMKMVRRNVTLPNWLNREAEAAHINVSRVLQEALMSKLNISKLI